MIPELWGVTQQLFSLAQDVVVWESRGGFCWVVLAWDLSCGCSEGSPGLGVPSTCWGLLLAGSGELGPAFQQELCRLRVVLRALGLVTGLLSHR